MKLLIVSMLAHLAWAKSVPKPCCAAEQFEAVLGADQSVSVSGQPMRVTTMTNFLSFDYKGQKTAMTSLSDGAGQKSWTKTIADYTAKKQYVITKEGCKIYPLPYPMTSRCVPPSAKYLGSSYFGGKTKIQFDSWSYYIAEVNANVTISLSQEDCTPLVESISTHRGTLISELVGAFAGFTLGIKDPNVFVPPPGCKTVNQKSPRAHVGHLSHDVQ